VLLHRIADIARLTLRGLGEAWESSGENKQYQNKQ